MKKLYLTLALALITSAGFAQSKIGGTNPEINPNAILELDSEANKGLLLPRVALTSSTDAAPLAAHVEGMTVYNTATNGDVVPGFYYNDGEKWSQMVTTDNKSVKFFYMPSIVFDTSEDKQNVVIDLFAEYKKQFDLANKMQVVGQPKNYFFSEGAPNIIPYFENATDLYYYVTDFDTEVFEVLSITEEGVMTYNVKAAATDATIMNIVFVVKP
ncbi:hypothetical protein ACYSNX_02620 [Myroides sp. LJL115]